jgi:hypothetical protein
MWLLLLLSISSKPLSSEALTISVLRKVDNYSPGLAVFFDILNDKLLILLQRL